MRYLSAVILIILACLNSGAAGQNLPAPQDSNLLAQDKLHSESITLLFELVNTIIDKNPDWQFVLNRLPDMEVVNRQELLDELTRRNAKDKDINKKIDALLESPAYRLYFAQFKTADPEKHREMFYRLPYQYAHTPGDISTNFLDLCRNVDNIQLWISRMLATVDLNHSRSMAEKWLPPGDYNIPEVYFVYDGMGDAFVRDGAVCFDLFGAVLSHQPAESRYYRLDSISVEDMEGTLAHEFHHVFASPWYKNMNNDEASWQQAWIDYITTMIVREGTAMLCDPPDGLRRKLMEDTAVVAYWITQLNEKFNALHGDSITSDDISAWYDQTSQSTAQDLLTRELARQYEGKELRAKIAANGAARPMMIYTLGWWMASHIAEGKEGPAGILEIIQQPATVYEHYNRSIEESMPHLVVDIGS